MATLYVVGSGVVGEATGRGFMNRAHTVTFVDIQGRKLDYLRKEGFNVSWPSEMDLRDVNAIFVSVTAPTTEHGIDLSFLEFSCKSIGFALERADCKNFPLIVIRCTIPPGTTERVIIPLLEETSQKRAGKDFDVVYNPEYLRAHHSLEDFLHPRVITVGCSATDDRGFNTLREIYEPFNAMIVRCSFAEAEFQKYVHNIFNATKISFFNEMREAAKSLSIDPMLAFQLTTISSQGVWDPVYGIRDTGPYGGACLPKDVSAWLEFADKEGLTAELINAVREVNRRIGGS